MGGNIGKQAAATPRTRTLPDDPDLDAVWTPHPEKGIFRENIFRAGCLPFAQHTGATWCNVRGTIKPHSEGTHVCLRLASIAAGAPSAHPRKHHRLVQTAMCKTCDARVVRGKCRHPRRCPRRPSGRVGWARRWPVRSPFHLPPLLCIQAETLLDDPTSSSRPPRG